MLLTQAGLSAALFQRSSRLPDKVDIPALILTELWIRAFCYMAFSASNNTTAIAISRAMTTFLMACLSLWSCAAQAQNHIKEKAIAKNRLTLLAT